MFVRIDPHSIPKGEISVCPVERPARRPGYINGAILPIVEKLQPVDDDLYNTLSAGPDTPSSATIELTHLSDRMLDATERLAEAPPGVNVNRLLALSLVIDAGLPNNDLLIGDPMSAPAGDLVSTRDPTEGDREGLFTGLHLDNRDKLPRAERINSRRRMVVNLGPGHRWAWFAVPDILEAADILESEGALEGGADRIPRRSLFCGFVDTHPDGVQCIRIPVAPGDAYIAPTDWVMHDGSTLDATEPSTVALFLGHWERGSIGNVNQHPGVS